MPGDGVPNEGPWQRREPGAIKGYRFRYHDQQVTGNVYEESAEISPAAYGTLRAAALTSRAAFDTALANSGWASFFGTWSGIDKDEAWRGVKDLA